MRNLPLWLGMIFLFMLLLFAFIGPYLPNVDHELSINAFIRENNKMVAPPFPPSERYLFGSDRLGRDVFSMLVLGAKETLYIIGLITLIRFIVALPLGVLAANKSNPAHWILRIWNQLFSRIPTLLVIILIVNIPIFIFLETNKTIWYIIIIAMLEVGRIAEPFRQRALTLSRTPFVEAGVSVGTSKWNLFQRYYWPHMYSQVLVSFVMDLGRNMLLIGQLGFFGIFMSHILVQLPGMVGGPANYEIRNISLAWPILLKNALSDIRIAIWIPFWTSFLIAYTIFTFNLLGEGLRRRFLHQYGSR